MTEWVRTVWFEDGQQCECSVPKDWIQNQIVNLPGGVKILGTFIVRALITLLFSFFLSLLGLIRFICCLFNYVTSNL